MGKKLIIAGIAIWSGSLALFMASARYASRPIPHDWEDAHLGLGICAAAKTFDDDGNTYLTIARLPNGGVAMHVASTNWSTQNQQIYPITVRFGDITVNTNAEGIVDGNKARYAGVLFRFPASQPDQVILDDLSNTRDISVEIRDVGNVRLPLSGIRGVRVTLDQCLRRNEWTRENATLMHDLPPREADALSPYTPPTSTP